MRGPEGMGEAGELGELRLCRPVRAAGVGVFHEVLISDLYFGFPALGTFFLVLGDGGQEQRQGHRRGARQVLQVRDRWERPEGGLSHRVSAYGPRGLPGKCVTGRFSC